MTAFSAMAAASVLAVSSARAQNFQDTAQSMYSALVPAHGYASGTKTSRHLSDRNNETTVGETGPTSVLSNSNTPRLTADGRVMFFNSTLHAGRPWARSKGKPGVYDSDIYYAICTVNADGTPRWGDPVNLGPSINTSGDDAVETISPNGGTIYYTSLDRGWLKTNGPFYAADLNGTELNNVHGLGGGISSFFATDNTFKIYGCAITADGNSFYFATTAHSETGEQQIWVSRRVNDEWDYPTNLGPNVNAPGGSFAPFIAADGRTLYFSSARKGGFGGDDIYVTVLKDGAWQMPANLGAQVNTAGNDTFFSIPASGDRVYLTRSDTEQNEATSIFTAKLDSQFLPSAIVLLTGTVLDKETSLPVDATVKIEDLSTNKLMQTVTGSGVDHRFAVVLQPGRDYGISVSAPGYGFYSMRYTIPSVVTYRQVQQDIRIDRIASGKTFSLNNIFFDYNSDTLRPESEPELQRLKQLLTDYSGAHILITGHTDNIGSEQYNDQLSLRRAEAVRSYLVDITKVDPKRIRTQGMGSRHPSAPNSTDEGRQRNRVVQFVVE
ncbi:MAG: OmpA family protein [Bacteroidetes bacterium]|nr:OmpA family protein [Bacteroidota bacterium]